MKTYQKILLELGAGALSSFVLCKLDLSLHEIEWLLSKADWYKNWLLDCRLLCWLVSVLSWIAICIDFALNVLPELKTVDARKQITPSKQKLFRRLQWIPVVLMVITLLYLFFHVDQWRFHSAMEYFLLFVDFVALFGFSALACILTEWYTLRTRLWRIINGIAFAFIPFGGIGMVVAMASDELPDAFYNCVFIYSFFVLPVVWLINVLHLLLPAPPSWKCKMKSHRFFCCFYIVASAIYFSLFVMLPLVQNGIEKATRYKYARRHEACNSVYYWRTTLKLTDNERAFVHDHGIKRIYLHLFDVEMSGYQDAVPVATLLFQDSLPGNVEYVPTVYITQDAIRNISGNEKEIAEKIVKRVLNIVDYHYIPNVKEVQIDGDWQESTRYCFFRLCKEMRKLLHEQDIALSATIRLSQLREPAPPVDYGMLMLYNTNSVRDVNTENSILSIPTCRQYLKDNAIRKYDLRLDYAIPAFEWAVTHSEDGYFRHLSGSTDFNNAQFEPLDSTHYRVKWSDVYHGQYYLQNDRIRIESTPIELLRELKENIAIPAKQSIALYHLDEKQISRYSYEDIENIFAR